MQTRRFGRTNHMSSVAIFGGFALGSTSPEEAEKIMDQVLAAGVNHIDIAPTYGRAEERLGPWLVRRREAFFLGCKTQERGREAAAAQLRRSLERLQTASFDLLQLHAVNSVAELDQCTAPGGALEALIEAREQGLTRYLGITGHGVDSPSVFLEALRRFDFDSVIFPINFIQYADPQYRRDAEALLAECRRREVGVMTIKAVSRGPWGIHPKNYTVWYRPFEQPEIIQQAVNFVLSQDCTGLCTCGDPELLPLVLEACQNFTPLTPAEQEALIATAGQYEPLFV